MQQNVTRLGAKAIMVIDDWGTAIDLEKVKRAVIENPNAKALAFVHAETSTGVRNDIEALCSIARENNLLTIVDTVTGLAGHRGRCRYLASRCGV